MYEKMKLEDRLSELKDVCRRGEQNQAIVNEIYEVEMKLANIYYIYD